MGNEFVNEDVSLDYLQKIIHARVEETLVFIQRKLYDSGLYNSVNTIILTGGMSKIPGIELLAREIFHGIHIQIKNPKNIQNGYVNFNDSTLSAIAGLIIYALDTDPSLEFDSNKNLREKVRKNKPENVTTIVNEKSASDIIQGGSYNPPVAPPKAEGEKPTPLAKIMKKISEWI